MQARHAPVTVIIRCYNEAERLPAFLGRLRALRRDPRTTDWQFLFVDDGSTDNSFATLLEAARGESWIEVLRLHENLGLGAAMRMGFERAMSEIVCTMGSSNCRYPLERLPELTQLIDDGADIATASTRPSAIGGDDGTRLRLPLMRRVPAIYKQVVKQDVRTITCLFRAYRRRVLENIHFRSDGFLAVAEISLKAVLAGYSIRELPLPLERRRYGESELGVVEAKLARAQLFGLTVFEVCMQRARQTLDRSASGAQ
jgi:glycosyltransferase involved in cell wall biosynthesis